MRLRLATKILLLTLAIALGLAGGVAYFVSRDVRRVEVGRARARIHELVQDYVNSVQSLHERVESIVRLVMEEPVNRSQLEQIGGTTPEAQTARVQLGDEVFGWVVQRELSQRDFGAPKFHVLLDLDGTPLLRTALRPRAEAGPRERPYETDPVLQPALDGAQIEWPVGQVAQDASRTAVRTYVRIAGKLYLAMGVPLRSGLDPQEPPSHVYFIGYEVDQAWTRLLVRSSGLESHGEVAANAAPISLQAAFFMDGKVIASYSHGSSGQGLEQALTAVIAKIDEHDAERQIEFDANGEHFIGEAITFHAAPSAHGALAVASSLDQQLKALHELQRTIAIVTGVVLLLAVVAFQFVSQLIARPVRRLVAGSERIARGELGTAVVLNRRDELGDLATSFNMMAEGLRQRERIKDTFGKFVDPRVAEKLWSTGLGKGRAAGERLVQSILFTDLEGFTSATEKLSGDDVVALLNDYLADGAEAVQSTLGIVDKFVGDAVVAFWGPQIVEDYAARACRTALRYVRQASRHRERCEALGIAPLRVRAGISTGEVVVGIIGSPDKWNYTVIGDAANLGSRLEGLNKVYGTSVLACSRTAAQTGESVIARRIDRVRVVGRAEAVDVYEILAERAEDDAEVIKTAESRRAAYDTAWRTYADRNWDAAANAFAALAESGDKAATVLAARCRRFAAQQPEGWDGVWNLESK